MKRVILMLTVVSLLVTITTFGKGQGDLAAPDGLVVDRSGWPTVEFTWNRVPGAVKYSVVIEGVVTVDDILTPDPTDDELDIDVEIELGTPVDPDDPATTVSIVFELADVKADILAQLDALGYGPENIISLNEELAMLKVKGLDPSLPENKRQNNPFATAPLFDVD